MRLLWALPCVLALSCVRRDHTTLRDLLSMKGALVTMTHVNPGTPHSAFISVSWRDPPARCPKLDPDLKALIDGRPAEAALEEPRTNEPQDSPRCEGPQFGRLDVSQLATGEEHQFVLEDRSLRFEGRLRRVSGDVAAPGPYPGPGGRWFVAWSGPPPSVAVLGNARLGLELRDDGFDLVLPDPLSDPSRLRLLFPAWEVSHCSFGSCAPSGMESWDFKLDGGVITSVEHTVY